MDELLDKIREITIRERSAYEESRRRGEQFNIFHACGVDHYETKHSGIIAELLNPDGSHGQGVMFLKSFLEVCKPELDFSLDGHVQVETEAATDDGRIDILITNEDGQALIIENKIYAEDQQQQLKRYDQYARCRYGEGKYWMLYLTLDGRDASEQSGGEVDYQNISYADDIVKWLDECIKQCDLIPAIRETLLQYKKHIMLLTNQDSMLNQDDLFRVMTNHQDEVTELAKAINRGYFEWVYEHYVKDGLVQALNDFNLILDEVTKVQSWMCFYRPNWKKTAICIGVERGYHYIGVSCANEGSGDDMKQMEHIQLDCLPNKPTPWWPYGWDNIRPYNRWGIEDGIVQPMISGDFTRCIMRYVEKIVNEIDAKGILMP